MLCDAWTATLCTTKSGFRVDGLEAKRKDGTRYEADIGVY